MKGWSMEEAIVKIIPILLLITFGKLMRSKNWIDSQTADTLKSGIIRIGLPIVLFLTFKDMTLEKEFLFLSLISFFMLTVFYVIGSLVNRIAKINNPALPFLATGFSFGLLGVPLFGGVYGIDHLSELSILGIGNEFFLWFLYITLLRHHFGKESFSIKAISGFLRSPLIIAILTGLLLNLSGLHRYFDQLIILKGLNRTLESLATMTTPLMLIIIGYGIKLEKPSLVVAARLLLIRLIIVFALGYMVKLLVIDPFLHPDSTIFNLAFFTFLILPPPFSLAIFMGEYCSEDETTIVNNTVVLSTLACLVLFIGMVLMTSL